MKILFICQEYELNLPRSARVKAFCERKAIHEVHVMHFKSSASDIDLVSAMPLSVPMFLKYTVFRDFCNTRSQVYLIDKMVGVLIRILLNFIKVDKWEWLQNQILNKLDGHQFSHIIISVAPFSNYLLAQKIRSRGGAAKLILDIGDPLSNNPGLDKGIKVDLDRYEWEGISAADSLVVTNNNTAAFFRNNFSYGKEISILPNGFKTSDKMFPTEVAVKFDEVRAIYAGAIYETLRPIKPLLRAFSKLGPKTQIQVVSNLEHEIKGENIKWTGRLSQNELVTYYEKSNLFIYIDNNRGIQTSSKIYELLAFGLPILFVYDFESENYNFAKNFKWVHFVNNDETSIYNYLTGHICGKELIYFPDYQLVQKYEWTELAKCYYQKLEEMD